MRADSSIEEELSKSNGSSNDSVHPCKDGTDQNHYLISGEHMLLDSKIELGQLLLTNYRILIREINFKWISIPLKSIETIEGISPTIKILCKDVKIFEFSFTSHTQYTLWEPKLQEAIKPLTNPLDAFAITFYKSFHEEHPKLFETLKEDSLRYEDHMNKAFMDEYDRLGFKDSNVWRISNVNEQYELCETYPRHVIVPTAFNDDDLPAAAEFRSNRRFPVPVWRHTNGAVLIRSSQPSIGIFSNRSPIDENLLDNISQACAASLAENKVAAEQNPDMDQIFEGNRLLVVDCRTFTSAFANRVRGGGYENIYNYKNVELRHMNIPNIHFVQQGYTTLRTLLFSVADESKRLVRNDEWYDAISSIIFAARVASAALDRSRPVLVHCSDGWDRTPQITSLAAILLDPFYRTIKGFQILVEREFIDFGHKFAERNELVSKQTGEKSPIFLQFLECVYQLIIQFPTEFEYNDNFLMKLGQHIYSNLFGDFLFNTSSERTEADIRNKSFSVWCLFKIDRHRYINILHDSKCQAMLWPSAFSVNLVIWRPFYVWFTKYLSTMGTTEGEAAYDTREAPPCLDGLNFITGNTERYLLEHSIANKTTKVENLETKVENLETNVENLETNIENLEAEMKRLMALNQKYMLDLTKQQEKVDDVQSLPDSNGTGSQGQESVVSDSSWESVEAAENPATWTPDHAASYCMDCKVNFWTGMRKHHCRGCGRVFCHECTKNRLPVPKENLHLPVRVCRSCVDCEGSPPQSPPMTVST